MSWDRKRNGPAEGYFYLSVRVPGKPHPVKRYMGRGVEGHEAAAEVERRKQRRRKDREALHAEQEADAALDALTEELLDWADTVGAAWLVATGHHRHRGEWRRKREQEA